MKWIVFLSFLFAFNLSSYSQKITASNFIGEWKIKKWIFIITKGSSENLEQPGTFNNYKEFLGQNSDSLKYINRIVTIDSLGIFIPGNGRTISYLFDSCYKNFLKQPLDSNIFLIKVVGDTKYTNSAFGQEIADKNIIGRHFLHFLDRNYSSSFIKAIETNCIKNGITLQILIINKNKIVIYRKMDAIVLERK